MNFVWIYNFDNDKYASTNLIQHSRHHDGNRAAGNYINEFWFFLNIYLYRSFVLHEMFRINVKEHGLKINEWISIVSNIVTDGSTYWF